MKQDIQLNAEAVELREAYGYFNKAPVDIFSIVLSNEHYTLMRYPMSEHISGMCTADGNSKIIAINSAMSLGRQRFSAAHELYHLEIEKIGGSICKNNSFDEMSDSEKEADMFASYFLLPYEALRWYAEENEVSEWSIVEIIKISQFYQISYQAILFRLRKEERISNAQYQELIKKNPSTEARKIGVNLNLYKRNPDNFEESTIGEYSRLLEEAKDKDRITASLYSQYAAEGLCLDKMNYEGDDFVYD